ncbi:surface protease GP63, putative, partial [Trypanosoma cruzi marinkellei]
SGTKYNTCSDATVNYLPGSLTGSDSWCLDAKLLEKKDGNGPKRVEGVCAQVSCAEGTVKVKYGDSKDFEPCPDGTEISVTLDGFQEGGKIKCPKYGEVCTIAANGSSLVIPSALEDDNAEEQEKEKREASVVAPALSQAEEPSTGEPHEEEPPTVESHAEEPHAAASSTEEPHAEASIAVKTPELPVVQATLQAPQQESKAEQKIQRWGNPPPHSNCRRIHRREVSRRR